MNLLENAAKLLETNPNPAFLAKDGKIICANTAALQRFITVGCDIQPLLLTGADEYESFTGDCLCLRLNIENHIYDALVQLYEDMHLFILETPSTSAELRAMALVSQELRLPLNGMVNLTDELLPEMLDSSSQTAQQLAALNKNLHQLLRIVGNMSDAYRFSTMAEPVLETIDLTSFFHEHFEKIKTLLEHTRIDFQYEDITEDLYIPVNSEILSKGIYNLFSNAIKFTPAGGSISAKLTKDQKKLSLTIANTGNMPDHIRNSAFRRFLRQPAIEDGRYGIGLGMEVVRASAAVHRGTVLMSQNDDTVCMTLTISLLNDTSGHLRSPILRVDTSGGLDLGLIQLSDALPAQVYKPQ